MKASSNVRAQPRTLAYVRLLLGILQITGVGLSLGLLVFAGITTPSLVAVVCTCLITCVSVLVFGRWSKSDPRR